MFVKVIHFKRKKPRGKKDLRRLIDYLLSPKIDPNKGKFIKVENNDNSEIDYSEHQRLLGPPKGRNILSLFPRPATEIEDYAHDICNQMFDYVKDKAVEHSVGMPEDWYTHYILSFHPNDRSRFKKHGEVAETDTLKTPIKKLFFIADWYLTQLGLSEDHRVLYVAHGDRKHWHVHAIIALPNSLIEAKKGLLHLSRQRLRQVAMACTDKFQLTKPSPKLIKKHEDLQKIHLDAQ